MKHDKKSFLAGIAVGRSLSGWGVAGTGGEKVVEKGIRIIPATFDRNLSVLAPLVLIPSIIPVTYIGPEEVI